MLLTSCTLEQQTCSGAWNHLISRPAALELPCCEEAQTTPCGEPRLRRPKSTWRERGFGGGGETERDIY